VKALFLVFAFILGSGYAFAQTATLSLSDDIEGERARIQAERSSEEARYQEAEASCYAQLTVADCIRKLRVQRRTVLDRLRKQDSVLNDADRQRKALAQIEQIKEKSSPQRVREEAAKRHDALEAWREREDRAIQKAKSDPATGRITEKMIEPGRSAEDISKERQQYNDKLKEAQSHRLSQEKSSSEKSKPASKPLPAVP
jgi:hypothetical protein